MSLRARVCPPRGAFPFAVPYFQSGTVEDDFLASAALALRSRVLCRTESIFVESLTIIERGIAAVRRATEPLI